MGRRVNRLWLAWGVGLVAALGLLYYARDARGRDVYAYQITPDPAGCPSATHTLAVIGDYGNGSDAAAGVASLVHSWSPDWVVTTGDNNYPTGSPDTIDANIGRFYGDYIFPYLGEYGPGATSRRFYPALGNHDLDWDGGRPYFDYFTLPGNERYYTVRRWPVQLYVLNSDWREPDGIHETSAQAAWLRERLAASDAPWKLVVLHQPPFTSSLHRDPALHLQWPFAEWGASAVLAGHDHFYERLESDGIPYFVNGAGGAGIYAIGTPEPQSLVRYNRAYGALRIDAGAVCIHYRFYSAAGELIDSLTVVREVPEVGPSRLAGSPYWRGRCPRSR